MDTIPTQHDPARESLCQGKGVEETMFKLLEPFSEKLIDDDAALSRKKIWEDPLAGATRASIVTDFERDPHQAKKEIVQGEK